MYILDSKKTMKNKFQTMKTTKLLTLILAIFASISITSCVEDDDYSIPNSLGNEENAGLEQIMADLNAGTLTEISIADLKTLYQTYEDAQSGFDYDHFIQIPDNLVVKGYVTSSDATGNFYKEFYMQDAPENPTAAIGVVLNQVDSYNQFNIGREVYIKLKDMYVGYNSNEVISVGGKTDDQEVGQFTANQIPTKIFRSEVTETIVPLQLSLSQISESNVGMFVTATDVQFPENLEGSTYGDPSEDFDTQRTLQACEGFGYSNFIVETSSFSNFYNTPLPTTNGGTISGVVLKSYGGDNLVMLLNDISDVEFNNSRCTPLDINDFNVVFEETFDSQGSWEVTNTVGTRDWYNTGFGGENYMRATAFSSGNIDTMVSWLISPSIDFDAQNSEQLLLEIADAYSNGQPLKAYYSNDYTTGTNPDDATWIEIGADEINALGVNTGFYDNNYEATGLIDLSMVTGNAVLAFVYDSNNGTISTTIDLSDVKILAE
jgi:hypothetical protein